MKEKLNQVKTLLTSDEIDAILISSVPHITHLTGYANFSLNEREAYLLITPNEQYIFTDGRYTEAIVKQVKDFSLVERRAGESIEKYLQILVKKHGIQSIGVEESNLTVFEFNKFKNAGLNLKGVNIHHLRSIKNEEEIEKIARACKIADQAFKKILKKIKPGKTEKEIALELEFLIKKMGATLSFDSIVAFGPNSSIPHHESGQFVLKGEASEFILLDFGSKVENYCSDMTRTLFYKSVSLKAKKIYQTVLDAQKKAVDFILKNISKNLKASDVDKVARDYILSQGFPTIPHSLGHGIGLEVHEPPRLSPFSKEVLQGGMVFSIEPGIYIPGFGGVRIEDLYVIEGSNLRQLTNADKAIIAI